MRPKPETPDGTEPPKTKKMLQKYVKPDSIVPAEIDPDFIAPYVGELTDAELLADQRIIEDEVKRMFPPDFVQVLKKLSYYLSTVGLDFDEACLMIRFQPDDIRKKIQEFPVIQQLIDVKELEYKVNLIKTVSSKATTGKDEKLAQWLLERRFPNEFNPKKGAGLGDKNNDDLLAAAVSFIQKTSDKDPLVRETSGRAFVIKKNSQEDIVTAVTDMLK